MATASARRAHARATAAARTMVAVSPHHHPINARSPVSNLTASAAHRALRAVANAASRTTAAVSLKWPETGRQVPHLSERRGREVMPKVKKGNLCRK